jgi:hypothetical protein
VDIVPLYWWLGLLKALHPGYSHIELPAEEDKEDAQARLLQLQSKIVSQAQMVHSKLSRHIEKRAGADIANVRCLPEDHDLDVDDDIDSDSSHSCAGDAQDRGSESSHSSSDSENEQTRDVEIDDPHLEEKLNFILKDTIIIEDTSTTPESDPSEVLSTLQSMLERNPDDQGPPQTSFCSVRSKDPINEFGNTDILFYMALPTLFPFGRGLPEGSSALPHKIVRHLLLQYHARHARDQRFCFSQFNIMQRHAASRAAVLRVRNSKKAINEFTAMINDSTFRLRLGMAVDDPDSNEAKLLARQIQPLVTSIGATIPYSPSERKDMFSRCYKTP